VYIGGGLAVVGSLATLGVRIWELVDLIGVIDEMKREGRIVAKPSIAVTPENIFVGVSYSY